MKFAIALVALAALGLSSVAYSHAGPTKRDKSRTNKQKRVTLHKKHAHKQPKSTGEVHSALGPSNGIPGGHHGRGPKVPGHPSH
jgi:hypothetical protein